MNRFKNDVLKKLDLTNKDLELFNKQKNNFFISDILYIKNNKKYKK